MVEKKVDVQLATFGIAKRVLPGAVFGLSVDTGTLLHMSASIEFLLIVDTTCVLIFLYWSLTGRPPPSYVRLSTTKYVCWCMVQDW